MADGEVVKLDIISLGLTLRHGPTVVALPQDGEHVITREEWPAWCEANRDRIEVAARSRRAPKPRVDGQLDLLAL